MEEERQEFFEKLRDHNKVKRNEEIIIMGDFNNREGSGWSPWKDHLELHSDNDTEQNATEMVKSYSACEMNLSQEKTFDTVSISAGNGSHCWSTWK